MKQRRQLAEHLSSTITEVEEDFIKIGNVPGERNFDIAPEVTNPDDATSATFDQAHKETTQRRRRRSPVIPTGLIPITVRLQPEIAAGLKRASLERQLYGEDIHTQQDIVETALEPWLRNHGYLGKSD